MGQIMTPHLGNVLTRKLTECDLTPHVRTLMTKSSENMARDDLVRKQVTGLNRTLEEQLANVSHMGIQTEASHHPTFQ